VLYSFFLSWQTGSGILVEQTGICIPFWPGNAETFIVFTHFKLQTLIILSIRDIGREIRNLYTGRSGKYHELCKGINTSIQIRAVASITVIQKR